MASISSLVAAILLLILPCITSAYPSTRTTALDQLLKQIIEPTCRAPFLDDDYSAKHSRDVELAICENFEELSNSISRRQTANTQADDYSCSESKPCANGACCSKKTGYCNYGPEACGPDLGHNNSPNDVCWSNCDAVAECGKYALPAGKTCPLNVCCSEFGFVRTSFEMHSFGRGLTD
jgi:chitinase